MGGPKAAYKWLVAVSRSWRGVHGPHGRTIVNVALPTLGPRLRGEHRTLEWL